MENMTFGKVLLTFRPLFRSGRAGVGILLLLAATGAACATYREVPVGELPSRQPVRLQLTSEELVRHLEFADNMQRHLNGRFVELRGDSAVFLLTTPVAHRQVSIPLSSIVVAERKDPDHVKSILLSSAIVGTVATLAYLGFEGRDSVDPQGPGPVVDAFRPTFRLVLPIGR